jgi:hypothetical protein
VQDPLQAKCGAIKCESGNVEVQWKNMSDLVRKDNRKSKKPWITHKMIKTLDDRKIGRISTTKNIGRNTED